MEDFNPIHDIKALTAALVDEPTADRHLGVLPMEWLAQEIDGIYEKSTDDPKTIAIEFLSGDSRPEAYHLLNCEPCLSGLLQILFLYRRN